MLVPAAVLEPVGFAVTRTCPKASLTEILLLVLFLLDLISESWLTIRAGAALSLYRTLRFFAWIR